LDHDWLKLFIAYQKLVSPEKGEQKSQNAVALSIQKTFMQDEQKILHWLKVGDKRGIECMYDQYADALYGIVLRIVTDEQIAQDVLQEAFVKIWKRANLYDSTKGTLFTWSLNIVRNTAIDKTRSKGFRKSGKIQAMENFVDTGKQSFRPEHIGMKKMVSELEGKYREVIDLIYFNGYTQKEVEEELGIPLGTVKSRLRIGLKRLRTIFETNFVSLGIILLCVG
jgi:RNA polymerase sigma factor (sigma-70 family)